MKKNILSLSVIGLLLAGCATQPRFEFGSYEPTLYAFYKQPAKVDKFDEALQKAIDKGLKTDRLAPGLYAELGYIRLSQGDTAEAIRLFEMEAEKFQESAYFMKRIVNNLNGN